MKKFIVRRDVPAIGKTSRQEWASNAARSNRVVSDLSPDIVWLRSLICQDTAYCEYFAKDIDVVLRHSERVGFPATSIEEVCTEVQPSDANDDMARVRQTYAAAADHYDAPQLGFWDRAGKRSVQALGLSNGARVLDVGCGSGMSAIPAAEAVGSAGSVLGIDLAEPMLELARQKARQRGLAQACFRKQDMRYLNFSNEEFDAVISVFSLFFVADMPAFVGELWRMVAPGGKLSITTWGPRVLQPAAEMWWHAVSMERPDLVQGFRPWDAINEPAALTALLVDAGLPAPEIHETADCQPMQSPEDWWPMVLGSGFRWSADMLGPEAAQRVKAACLQAIDCNGITSVECNTIQAVATKAIQPSDN